MKSFISTSLCFGAMALAATAQPAASSRGEGPHPERPLAATAPRPSQLAPSGGEGPRRSWPPAVAPRSSQLAPPGGQGPGRDGEKRAERGPQNQNEPENETNAAAAHISLSAYLTANPGTSPARLERNSQPGNRLAAFQNTFGRGDPEHEEKTPKRFVLRLHVPVGKPTSHAVAISLGYHFGSELWNLVEALLRISADLVRSLKHRTRSVKICGFLQGPGRAIRETEQPASGQIW